MAEKHFHEQIKFAQTYLIPYLTKHIPEFSNLSEFKILSVGCAEGGDLMVFSQNNKSAAGIELSAARVEMGKKLNPEAHITTGDITKKETLPQERFDMIILRDVIEHVNNKNAAFENIYDLLKPGGYLFMTFPLKYSPYAGHQQMSKTFLKYFVYITLFPVGCIRFFCKLAKTPGHADEIIYNKKNAFSYHHLNHLVKKRFTYRVKEFFILRPGFNDRYGLPELKMPGIPLLRELALGCEVLLKKQE